MHTYPAEVIWLESVARGISHAADRVCPEYDGGFLASRRAVNLRRWPEQHERQPMISATPASKATRNSEPRGDIASSSSPKDQQRAYLNS